MTWKIPLASVEVGDAERAAVDEVLRSGWLSMGGVTQRFERAFAERVGVRHAFAVTNGTAALHLAHAALGLGAGDEVAVPAFTFVATANAIAYTGADPLFVDVASLDDLTLSPAALEERIGPRTRAVTVVHYGGYLADMEAIVAMARRRGLAVVEDAAHAPGASRGAWRAGACGDVACFSLFANKNVTTGEGGVVVTDRDDLAERIRLMRSHGMTTLTWDRWQGHAHSYDVVAPGYNYRFDEIRAALGLAQLERLEPGNAARTRLVGHYRACLATIPGVAVPFARHDGTSSHYIFPVVLDDAARRPHVIEGLARAGIQTSVHYPAIHRFSYYRDRCPGVGRHLPLTEAAASRELTLPLYPAMSTADVETVAAALSEALHDAD